MDENVWKQRQDVSERHDGKRPARHGPLGRHSMEGHLGLFLRLSLHLLCGNEGGGQAVFPGTGDRMTRQGPGPGHKLLKPISESPGFLLPSGGRVLTGGNPTRDLWGSAPLRPSL